MEWRWGTTRKFWLITKQAARLLRWRWVTAATR